VDAGNHHNHRRIVVKKSHRVISISIESNNTIPSQKFNYIT
jgi:hypothetical protein